ncbi:hypothetical protein SAMN07250955_1193 [Arboricoccus pini]|uniref:DUF1109 domain-containing protein n=1 Tax=Arboricoccus pini TaxID=1963835 RepID=A0A212S0V7_9PROT|nr:NrsF family protein [Arboricoccus pini]SNB78600.1 hypothetical protein SAMN07250955_1193 [Arboricoccus pini]
MAEWSEEQLIDRLAADLKPVRKSPSASLMAGLWLAVVVAISLFLALVSDVGSMLHRLTAAPDMWLAVLGSSLTTILAAIAAFQTSIPGRNPYWGLLPLPALAIWIGFSGLGCLRDLILPDSEPATIRLSMDCVFFILGLSVPLSALMIIMLRRTFPLRPNLTALLGGIAAAAAAATLLNFFHPFNVTASDLLLHALAIGLIVGCNRLLAKSAYAPGSGR